jgi:hypothetical protein
LEDAISAEDFLEADTLKQQRAMLEALSLDDVFTSAVTVAAATRKESRGPPADMLQGAL